jgi:flavin reductase (DIM6/NTAB) family NADH-FMN oxidoreductase RutF
MQHARPAAIAFCSTTAVENFSNGGAEMAKKSFSLAKVYGLLEPGPVVLVSTAREGRANIMTMSWHTMLDFTPPVLGCVISSSNFSFEILEETGECVINIPTVELAEKVVGCGNTSGRKLDKFKLFGLTPAPASSVKAPLIDECYANLECKVVDRQMIPAYNLFVLEVLKAWINPAMQDPRTIHHRGKGSFMVAGETIKLASNKK